MNINRRRDPQPELTGQHRKRRNSYMFRSGVSTSRWVFRDKERETEDAAQEFFEQDVQASIRTPVTTLT